MRTKKRLVILVLLLSMVLSSCSNTLSESDGFALFEQGLDAAVNAQIYYWKELDLRDPSKKLSSTVNVHCKVDDAKYEYVMDEEGHYVDKKVHISQNVNSQKTNEIFCGAAGEETESLYVKMDGNGKEESRRSLPVNDFLASKEFAPYALSEKLKPLLLLQEGDLEFIAKQDHKQAGESVLLNYKVSDAFLAAHPDSMLQGSKLYIELAYGKLTNFTVYQSVSYGKNLQIDEEVYSFKVVYLGPKINVPSAQ